MNAEIVRALLSVAAQSDVLIFGETHGTQEVPHIVSSLLDSLYHLNYRVLGIEVLLSEQDALHRWATEASTEPPGFFSQPSPDGRGNEQLLSCARQATRAGWQILCFDIAQGTEDWSQRDKGMAENLLAQWHLLCPKHKVVCICGNLHSRLAPLPKKVAHLWPSFAAQVQQMQPELIVKSINIVFHSGEFFNYGVKPFAGVPIQESYFSEEDELGHSGALHLPHATAATFLSPPQVPGVQAE